MMISNKFYLTDGDDELSHPSVEQMNRFIEVLSLYIYCQSDENTFVVQDDDLLYFLTLKDELKNQCVEHNMDLRGIVYQTEPVAQVDIFCNGEFGLLVIEPVDDNDKLLYDYLKNTEPSY
jgi:hypothetical protein